LNLFLLRKVVRGIRLGRREISPEPHCQFDRREKSPQNEPVAEEISQSYLLRNDNLFLLNTFVGMTVVFPGKFQPGLHRLVKRLTDKADSGKGKRLSELSRTAF